MIKQSFASGIIKKVLTHLATILTVLATAGSFVRVPVPRTSEEVTNYIRKFLAEPISDREWSEFTLTPIQNPDLEQIRIDVGSLSLPLDEEARGTLREFLSIVEAL